MVIYHSGISADPSLFYLIHPQTLSVDLMPVRRNPLSSRHPHYASCPSYYLMPPRCPSTLGMSMLPRRRSLSWYVRRKPGSPVRSVPRRRGVSIAVTNAPALLCRGRRIAYVYSSACASASAPIATACAASSRNGCPRLLRPGPGAPSGWRNASSRWAGGPGYASATRGTWR